MADEAGTEKKNVDVDVDAGKKVISTSVSDKQKCTG